MSLITTQVITAQAMATGYPAQATKLALQAATNAAGLEITVTTGSAGPDGRGQYLQVYFLTSALDLSAAAAAVQLVRSGLLPYVFLLPQSSSAEAKTFSIPPKLVKGGFAYLWFDIPTMANAATLDAYVTELTV